MCDFWMYSVKLCALIRMGVNDIKLIISGSKTVVNLGVEIGTLINYKPEQGILSYHAVN